METLHQPNNIIAQRYRPVGPLGRGGNGTTYEAEDLTDYKRVAIKALSLRNLKEWKVLELFEREAKILANLDHPAIPKYLDYFHEDTPSDRHFYLVQQLVSGDSLAELVEKGWHPDEGEVKRIALKVLDILHYLHRLTPPVIHRDIKPQNLIRTSKGEVFLVDFGAVQDVHRNTLTRGGTFVGTLGYMPPEQFSGNVKPASDLYSLGATLLFLLIRRSPDNLPQRRMKIDFRRRVNISSELADWLEKMLEPAIEDRFQSATEAKEALNANGSAKQEPIEIKPVNLRYLRLANQGFMVDRNDEQIVVKTPNEYGLISLALMASLLLVYLHLFLQELLPLNPGDNLAVIVGNFLVLFSPLLGFILLVGSVVIFGKYLLTYTVIKIDLKNFQFQYFIGYKPYITFKGKTSDIEKIKLEIMSCKVATKTGEITRTERKCVLWHGVNKLIFHSSILQDGNPLTNELLDSLVAELSDFLKQVRSRT